MADAPIDNVEKRRQQWTKESLDRRREFLLKKGCDAEAVILMKGDELVQMCLVAENLVTGILPKKEVTVATVVDPMALMMQIIKQMRLDTKQREEQLRLENERRDEQMKIEKEARQEERERYERQLQ